VRISNLIARLVNAVRLVQHVRAIKNGGTDRWVFNHVESYRVKVNLISKLMPKRKTANDASGVLASECLTHGSPDSRVPKGQHPAFIATDVPSLQLMYHGEHDRNSDPYVAG
jgi:hypothetical protein